MDKGGLLAPSWLRAIPMVGTRLADAWNDAAGTPGGLSALLSRVEDGSLLHSLQSVGHLIALHTSQPLDGHVHERSKRGG